MNDETTKEIEDLSTLACSTDEVVRKRALVAMLARVVGRASQVDQKWADTDVDDADRYALEANLREVTKQRDIHKANAEHAGQEAATHRAVIGNLWARVPFRLADAFRRDDIVGAVEALVSENSAHATNAETLARDLAEARKELEKTRGERDAARALRSVTDTLTLDTVLQCLGGVLNDMTRGGDFEKTEAQSFHDSACVRLRSLAGSPEKVGRMLTEDEFAVLARTGWTLYDEHDGGVTDSFRAVLRWLEREGYLSVRLPPEG